MELKLDAKLLKALNGLFVFVIGIMLMAVTDFSMHWLVGLFMLFGACSLCGAWFLDGKKDNGLFMKAIFYLLFAIVFLAKVEAQLLGYYFFILWAMIEAAMLVCEGMNKNFNVWYICFGAMAILLSFIAAMAVGNAGVIMMGISFILVGLGNVLPMCEQYLPKVELKK